MRSSGRCWWALLQDQEWTKRLVSYSPEFRLHYQQVSSCNGNCPDDGVACEFASENENLLSKTWRCNCFPCIPARYMIALVSCLGFVNVYGLRVNLSVAIVQMVNSTATPRNGSARVGISPRCRDGNHDCTLSVQTFDWTSGEQGLLDHTLTSPLCAPCTIYCSLPILDQQSLA